MSNQIFFSVIVPTHARAHLLRRTLQSIKAQSFDPVQVIVVSDLQDFPTMAVCNELLGPKDSFVIRSGIPGPSESRNIGLSMATGQYVLFIDDDDAYRDGFFDQLHQRLKAVFQQVVFCNCNIITERREPGRAIYLGEALVDLSRGFSDDIFVKNSIHMSCIAFPRHLLSSVRFDTYMRAYEDWEFMLGAMKSARVSHVDLCGINVHEVHDETSDRRGGSAPARDFNAVVDYVYVYRRHPAPSPAIQERRHQLLMSCGLNIPAYCL